MSRRQPTRVTPHGHRRQGDRDLLWRSLEDKDRTPEARRAVAETEFSEGQMPAGNLVPESSLGRRSFLQFSTAAAAGASLSACIRRPEEPILPYGAAPESVIPGVPNHYATVTESFGDALGLLVTTHEGRPTKIEGNPQHPRSLGATDTRAQAMLMDLYDPDRSQHPFERDDGKPQKRDWAAFLEAFETRLAVHDADQGAALRVVLPHSPSPSLQRVLKRFYKRFPRARVCRYDALPTRNLVDGTELAFGKAAFPVGLYHAANVVVALDSDFLGQEPGAVRSTQLFSQRRRPDRAALAGSMSRLYAVEPTFSVTGAAADHRLPLPANAVGTFLSQLTVELDDLVTKVRGLPTGDPQKAAYQTNVDVSALLPAAKAHLAKVGALDLPAAWALSFQGSTPKGLVADLLRRENRGAVLLSVGMRQPKEVHALAHALNVALGALGRTVAFAPLFAEQAAPQEIAWSELTADLAAGKVTTLINLGCNPALTSPADQRFSSELVDQVEQFISVTSHVDETSELAHWHVPLAHELEAWGDLRALDGSVAIQQPTIRPLWHGARSVLEIVALAAGESNWRGHAVVKETFERRYGTQPQRFHSALHRGLVADVGSQVAVTLQPEAVASAVAALPEPAKAGDTLEVNFVPCPKLLDGRLANNMWLQELPDSMTKLVWDNALLVAPGTAKALAVKDGDLLQLSRGDAKLDAVAVMALPGLPEGSATLALGHGRSAAAGRYAHGDELHGGGFDAYPLRAADTPWIADGVTVRKAGGRYQLTRTQEHGLMSGLSHEEPRAIVLESDVAGYQEKPDFAAYDAVDMLHSDPQNPNSPPPGGPLWEPVDYSHGHKWGMTIDLSACTGCNACVVACQAENNVPSVGKRQVARGREMYWLRIDRYFVGEDTDNPQIALQPVACQHCEQAPCEIVCPVNATVHSPEGMNDMAYNRCIGTRYCANNCPYKVRRFNYLPWHGYVSDRFANYDGAPETQKMAQNPNVTVRYRGVMEKCSYCVQRVNAAKIEVKQRNGSAPGEEGPRDEEALSAVRERLRRGQLQSACQQVCPADAIRFGDLNDVGSDVAKSAAGDRQYALLAELGTQPRTHFLAKIRNTNPDFEDHGAGHSASHQGHAHDHAGGHAGHGEGHHP